MADKRRVAKAEHLQCPVCFYGDLNGIARMPPKSHSRVSSRTMRYTWICDECGWEWTKDLIVVAEPVPKARPVEAVEVTNRPVRTKTRSRTR